MPASLTTNTVAPPFMSTISAGTRAASFWSNRLTTLPAIRTPSAFARVPLGGCPPPQQHRPWRARTPTARTRRTAGPAVWPPTAVDHQPLRQPTIADVIVADVEAPPEEREAPMISRGPLEPVADFGPTDR